MLFNSYIFIFLFLPLTLAGWFALNAMGRRALARLFLFAMSLWFYGYFNPSYLPIILVSILANFAFYKLSGRMKAGRLKSWALACAVLFNLAVLFYFKYYDFFLSNLNALFKTDFVLKNILLPLGISFFTFQQVSFVVDAFRGEVPDYDFLGYACFVTFFPQLVAGPIVTHDELVPQLMSEDNKRFDWDNFSAGLFIFTIGLAKKVLLADVLGGAVNYAFGAVGDYRWAEISSAAAWIAILAYTLQLYFDFSGYSDMAIGIGRMFNIHIPRNFNSPYKAITIVDFWKRWHMTLTRFLTKYVYFSLGGNRKGELRTYLNIMAVYLISGLWHGAGWTFILWGALHGAFSVVTRWAGKIFERIPRAINWFITFLYVNFCFTVFRADSVGEAYRMIARALRMSSGGVAEGMLEGFMQPEFDFILSLLPSLAFDGRLAMLLVFLAAALLIALLPKNSGELCEGFKGGVLSSLAVAGLLVWCIFSFAGVSTFLYFNF